MSFSFLVNPNWGKEIFRTHDRYGPIRVFDDGNKRYLAFDSIHEQSCQHKTYPHRLMHEYNCAMLIPLAFVQPAQVTLLGLGGGSLVHCLYRQFPDVRIQVVELRPAVLEVAQRYFQLPGDDARLDVQLMDAGEFLPQAAPGSSDLLLCDMYHAAQMDAQQAELEFIALCHRLLTPQGWLAINYSRKSECSQQALDFIVRHFSHIRVCNVQSGNQILLASKSPVTQSEREIQLRARQLNGLLGFPMTKYLKRSIVIKATACA